MLVLRTGRPLLVLVGALELIEVEIEAGAEAEVAMAVLREVERDDGVVEAVGEDMGMDVVVVVGIRVGMGMVSMAVVDMRSGSGLMDGMGRTARASGASDAARISLSPLDRDISID